MAYDLKFFSPTSEDAAFVQTAQYFDSVCFSYDLRLSDPAAARGGEEILPEAAPRDAQKILSRMALPAPEGDLSLVPESSHALLPAEAFCAFDLGFATAPRDADGVLRRLPLVLRHGDRLVPSLALCLAMRYLGLAPKTCASGSGAPSTLCATARRSAPCPWTNGGGCWSSSTRSRPERSTAAFIFSL